MNNIENIIEYDAESAVLIENVTSSEYTHLTVDNQNEHFSIHQPPAKLYTVSHKLDRNFTGSEPHIHLGYFEILYFLEGNVQYYIAGARSELRPGDVLLISPGTLHKGDVDTGTSYGRIVLHVSVSMLRMASSSASDLLDLLQKKSNHVYHLGIDAFSDSIRVLDMIPDMEKNSAVAQDILIRARIIQILVSLLQSIEANEASVTADTSTELMRKIMIYIDEHLTENLSLARIAEELNISRSLLSHEFKRHYGSSLWNYVIMRRLALSQELLTQGSSVTNACYDAGFQNYSNYIKTFSKTFGLTPRQYASSKRGGTVYL